MTFQAIKLSDINSPNVVLGVNKMGYTVMRPFLGVNTDPDSGECLDSVMEGNLKSLKYITINHIEDIQDLNYLRDKLVYLDGELHIPITIEDALSRHHKCYVTCDYPMTYNITMLENPFVKLHIVKNINAESSDVVDDSVCTYSRVLDADTKIVLLLHYYKNIVDVTNFKLYLESIMDHILVTDISHEDEKRLELASNPVMIDWSIASRLGLIEKINTEVLHKLGLTMIREGSTGLSPGLYISDELKWTYPDDHMSTLKSEIEIKEELERILKRDR